MVKQRGRDSLLYQMVPMVTLIRRAHSKEKGGGYATQLPVTCNSCVE